MTIFRIHKQIHSVLTKHLASWAPYHWVGSWLLRETHYQTHPGNHATEPPSPPGSLQHPPPDCTCSPGLGFHLSGYSAARWGRERLRLLLPSDRQWRGNYHEVLWRWNTSFVNLETVPWQRRRKQKTENWKVKNCCQDGIDSFPYPYILVVNKHSTSTSNMKTSSKWGVTVFFLALVLFVSCFLLV